MESELRAASRALRGTDSAGPRAMVDVSGPEQTEAGRHLDHAHPIVAAEVKKWLKDSLLDDLGFAGFRYDLATGYPARCVGRYNDHARPEMSVGEVWREDADQLFQSVGVTQGDSCLSQDSVPRQVGKSAAFDSALRAKLWEALSRDDFTDLKTSQGTPPGLIGLCPEAAVTFIENHDMEPVRGNGKAFPHDKILAGYAYILTHPGKPCVFWHHIFDGGQDQFRQHFETVITRMIGIRKEQGIHGSSHCEIVPAKPTVYAAIIDDRVAVKIGSIYLWHPGPGWTEEPTCWGKDFAIWTRSVRPAIRLSCTRATRRPTRA